MQAWHLYMETKLGFTPSWKSWRPGKGLREEVRSNLMRLPFFFFFFFVGLFVLLQTAGLQNTIFWLHQVFRKAFCLWVAQIKTTYEYKAFLGQDGTFIWWLFMLKVIAPSINLFDSQETELAYNHFLCVIMEGHCWALWFWNWMC